MSPEVKLHQEDPVRAKLEEYLAGMDAVRKGVLTVYFIEVHDDLEVSITPENVDAQETNLRAYFAERYPDLAPGENNGRD